MSDPLAEWLDAPVQAAETQPVSSDPLGDWLNEPATGSGVQLQAMRPQLDTSQPDEPKQKNLYEGVIEFTRKIQQAHDVGYLGLREAAIGNQVKSGLLTLEEAEAQIAEDDRLAELSGDLERYEQEAWDSWVTGIPTSIGIQTARMLPMLEQSLVPFGAGFGVGGGLTAATGVGATVAVPVGQATGTVAAAGWMADVIAGQEYLNRRREGMDHEAAAVAANFSGIVQGSLGGIQIGNVAKVPVTAAQSVLKAQAQSAAQFLVEGTKFAGVQLGLGEAQTAVKLMTDAISGTVSKVPGVVPTVEQAWKELSDTFKATLFSGAGLFIGGKAIGKAGGLTAKTFMKGVKEATEKHAENQKAKLQAIEDAAAVEAEGAKAEGEVSSAPKAEAEKSKARLEREQRAKQRLEKRLAAEREVKRIFDAANSLWRIESDETRLQETNRIQRLLRRMVSNSDLLDDKTKVTLLKRIVEIDGEKALLRLGDQFVEEQRGKEYANAKAAAEKRLREAIKRGQPKSGKAKLPAEVQKHLQWYKEFFDEPKPSKAKKGEKREPGAAREEARQTALQKATDFVTKGFQEELVAQDQQLERLENNEISELFMYPADLAEKRRIASEAISYWSGQMAPEAVHRLAEGIEATVKGERSKFLERKQQEAQRLLANRERVREGVQGIKPIVPSQTKMPAKPPMTDVMRVFNSLSKNTTALWDKVLQDSPADARERLINDVLSFTEQENKEFQLNVEASEKMSALYESAVGSLKETNRLIRDGSKVIHHDAAYIDSTGAAQNLGNYSYNQLAYLHNALQDPGALPGLIHGNKFTLDGMVEDGVSTQTVIREILTNHEGGKYLKLAEAVKDFYRWFAPRINNHYLKEYGVDLPMHDHYSGQIFHRHLERIKSATDILQDAHEYAMQSLDPGSIQTRKMSKLPIVAVDPFHQVQRHRADMNFWIANSRKARELSFIFSDTSLDGLRDVIKHKLGMEYTSMIDSRLAFQFHLKPPAMSIADKGLQHWKNNLATGMLGANFLQAPKQWTSILGALSTNDYASFLDGLRGAMDEERLKLYFENSGVYKERQDSLLPQILEHTQNRTYVDAVTGDNALKIKELFLTPMTKWGDGVASKITGFIEFNRVYKETGDLNKAVLAGDALVDRTQSSSRQSQKVPAEFERFGAFSLAFAKQNIQFLNLETGAIRDAFIHKDAKHWARAARTIAGIHAAQALFQVINSMPAWVVGDEKDHEDAALRIASAAIFGSFSSLPLVGVDLGYGVLSGFDKVREPRTIIGGLTGDITRMFHYLGKVAGKTIEGEEVTGEDWIKPFRSIAGVASVWTGIPFWGLWRNAEFVGKVNEKIQEGE